MPSPLRDLLALERLRLQFGPLAAGRKQTLLARLGPASMPTARALARLHEMLCFLRAYPDNEALLRDTCALLEGFARRPDLRRHRAALADSGIAGSAIHYRFFAGQAQWLAQCWPHQLHLDRSDAGTEARVAAVLPELLTPIEQYALREHGRPGYAALDRLRSKAQTDASFLLQRVAAMPGNSYTREALIDAMDASMVLDPGQGTPSRTLAAFAPAPVVFRDQAPVRERPDLRAAIRRAPRSVHRLPLDQGQALIDLARAAMVTRARSLETFSFADARDAWLVDDGDGLAIGLCGLVPERRHALATMVGGLLLRNGVPVGYLQADILGRSAALSFNTFETFRGGESAHLFARWLAALHRVYGCTTFSIEPYQLGRGNDEALDSGAWWFYARLGFAPRAADTLALAARERTRIARSPGHRSSRGALERLARHHLFFDLDPADWTTLRVSRFGAIRLGSGPAAHAQPFVDLAELGLQCGAALSARGGAAREAALDRIDTEVLHLAGLTTLPGFTTDAREAWRRLLPLLTVLDTSGWNAHEYRMLGTLARAKAGPSERAFVSAFLAHTALSGALHDWATLQVARLA